MHVSEVETVTGNPDRVERDLARLEEVIGQVVGSVFYGTLLETMRESGLKGPYGHGGRGEEVFSAQLHGIWAERLGTRTTGGLGEVLYGRLAGQQALISRQVPQNGEARA